MEKVLEHVSENLSVEIFPDDKFEFLITTNEQQKDLELTPPLYVLRSTTIVMN